MNNNNNNNNTTAPTGAQRNEETMSNNTHPYAVNNTIAREFVGARLTDVINNTATRMAADPNHSSNATRNVEIVRNVLSHAIDTVACIGGKPATVVVSETYADDIDADVVTRLTTYEFEAGLVVQHPLVIQDIACRLVNTTDHVVSIA